MAALLDSIKSSAVVQSVSHLLDTKLHLQHDGSTNGQALDLSDEAAVGRFQEFLRIPTMTIEGATNGAHKRAITFLQKMAHALGAQSAVHEYVSGFPVFVLSLPGSDPSLPSILLNSHYDVVPIMKDYWHYPAFEAPIVDGNIVARGAQDMKCVCSAYLEALLRLRSAGFTHTRTIHAAFMPDEEMGGHHGMANWINSDDYSKLNVGFALDEGLANTEDCYTVFYGERAVWWTRILASGPTGHGSRLIPNTATEKLMRVINKLMEFRKTQVALLDTVKEHEPGCEHAVQSKHQLGDVTTVNLTMLRAGVSADGGKTYSINVVPMHAEAGFDIRIPPSVPLDEFEAKLKKWTSQDEGITYDFYQKVKVHSRTSIDPSENPYYGVFAGVLQQLDRKIDLQIFPAGTDGRYLREVGVPVLGFSPIRLQPVLLHDHDERLSVECYLEGVRVYEKLIPALANMQR